MGSTNTSKNNSTGNNINDKESYVETESYNLYILSNFDINIEKIRNEFDKDKFFNRQPKDINLAKIKCLNTAKNLRKRDKEFLMNKEKNEKRLQSNSLTFETQADNKK